MSKYQFKNEVVDGRRQHLHVLDEKPLTGTSSVTKVLAKPLTWWASGLAVKCMGVPDPKILTKIKSGKATKKELADFEAGVAAAHGMIKGMDSIEYGRLLDKAYRAHAESLEESAEAGTDLHAELEKFVKNHMLCNDPANKGGNMIDQTIYDPKIQPFIEWTKLNVKRFLWSEMHCYSEKEWLGGITDAGAELNNGEIAIIDFKSAKDAYPEHAWQIAGYDIQITENGGYTADGQKIFTLEKPITQHIVVPFGSKHPLPVVFRDVEGGRRAFMAALTIYRELGKLTQ